MTSQDWSVMLQFKALPINFVKWRNRPELTLFLVEARPKPSAFEETAAVSVFAIEHWFSRYGDSEED